VFNFAEVLWYLSGRDCLDQIEFYAPTMRNYSADGKVLTGTAYGPRIFDFGFANIDQWNSIIRTLREDPDSKRAMIQIFTPEELLIEANIDVACTIGLQYMIREGELHAVTFMRANDAFRGAVSDVFSFTFLQELLAHQLGLQLGTYTHVAGSYHLYAADDARADELLADTTDEVSEAPFPRMPDGDNWPAIREVLAIEQSIRTGRVALGRSKIESLQIDPYWQQIVGLFALYGQLRFGPRVDEELLDFLTPLYSSMFTNVWDLSAMPPV
jgi:thymidylate synthase